MIAWESMAGMDRNESERSFLQKRELPLWISPERELSLVYKEESSPFLLFPISQWLPCNGRIASVYEST